MLWEDWKGDEYEGINEVILPMLRENFKEGIKYLKLARATKVERVTTIYMSSCFAIQKGDFEK